MQLAAFLGVLQTQDWVSPQLGQVWHLYRQVGRRTGPPHKAPPELWDSDLNRSVSLSQISQRTPKPYPGAKEQPQPREEREDRPTDDPAGLAPEVLPRLEFR